MLVPSTPIELATGLKDGPVFTRMALLRGHVPERAVPVRLVVPTQERCHPLAGCLEAVEAMDRPVRSVLERAEGGLSVGIVVTGARSREGALDAQPVKRCLQGSAFHGGAIVGMQHGRGVNTALSQHGTVDELASPTPTFRLEHFSSNDLAAVEVEDQVEIEELPAHAARQPRDVPHPDLVGCLGYTGRRC